MPSNLTPLQVNAASGLLQNKGLIANTQQYTGQAEYLNSSLIKPLIDAISTGKNANVLSSATISKLENLSDICPALCNNNKNLHPDIVTNPTKSNVYTTLGVSSWRDKLLSNIVQANCRVEGNCNVQITNGSIVLDGNVVAIEGGFMHANCYGNNTNLRANICSFTTVKANYNNMVDIEIPENYTDFDILVCKKPITPVDICPPPANSLPNGNSSNTFTSSYDAFPTLIGDFCQPGDTRWRCRCWATANSYGEFSTQLTDLYLGKGDYTIFVQAYNMAQAYMAQTNQFIDGSIVGNDYLNNTFNGMSDLITGSISSVNSNIKGFAEDLNNLGSTINLDDLNDLGSPLALVRQIINVAGYLPTLSLAFLTVGIPQHTVGSIGSMSANISDEVQKKIYSALRLITGDALGQILKVLKVKTKDLSTAADLLNPKKMFPNSYKTLKTLTPDGYIRIYSGDATNNRLKTLLPAYVLRSTA